jgi:OOP family OmpA-OmpF porin
MFNSNHGLKFDIAIMPLSRDINYNSFNKSYQARISAQYVVNVGRLANFERFAPRFSLLAHAGGGLTALKYKESFYFKSWKTNRTDEKINLIAGLTPQYKINERFEVHLDFSYNATIFQKFDQGFKWSDFTKNSSFGRVTTFSLGGMYYIGKKEKHVDWNYTNDKIQKPVEKIDSIPSSDSLLIVIYDTDKDGIMDSIDYCPEDFGLVEFGGCPKPEIAYDCHLSQFPIFTFNGARYEILPSYQPYFDSIAKCLKQNKDQKIIIYGYTDDFGEELFTSELSKNRAEIIKKKLVQNGVDADRIFTVAEGPNLAKLTESQRQSIKHNRLAIIKGISNNKNDIRVLETGEYLQGLLFTVQVGAYKKEIKNNKFNKYGTVLVVKSPDGFTRYSLNTYHNYEDAFEKWREIRGFGFSQDAFVTAYFMGERISLEEAKKLLEEKGQGILQITK